MNQPQYSSVYPSGAAIARSSLSAERGFFHLFQRKLQINAGFIPH